tara:strand:+ start:661 stop:1530 length:870 start_codon:yes stop_codon:yes gene_type:complete
MLNNYPSFTISIDLELAWGFWDKLNSTHLNNVVNNERIIVDQLLKIFEDFQFPVTWATVAALIDNKNKMTNIFDKNAWYAPDIIEKIMKSKTKHLIASHSYSHINFNENSKSIIIEDFEKAEYFFKTLNILPDVLIFPRNQVAHLEILNKFNFKFYRSLDKSWYKKVSKHSKLFGKVANIADKIFPFKTNPIKPIKHLNGLIEIPSSILLISRNGFKLPVTNINMFSKIKKGVQRAIENKECFHLWFHPSNFYYKEKKQFELLKDVLRFVNSKREQGLIDIKVLDQYVT